ncbi:MAG: DMT family transporter [Gammaproteobacteria bacterium]
MDRTAPSKEKTWGLTALFLGVIAIGMAPILVRFSHSDPSAVAFWRIFIALPFMYIIAFCRDNKIKSRPNRTDYLWMIVSGIAFAADLGFWHLSIQMTNIANATLFDNSAPIFVCLFTWLVFKQKLSWIIWIGLALTVLGGIALVMPHLDLSPQYLIGDAWGLVAAFFYALYIIAIGRARRSFSVMHLMAHSGLVSCLALGLIILVTGESFKVHSLHGWSAIIALALIVHLLGQGLIAYSLRFIPATLSSITLLGQAVIATIAAWFIFNEALSTIQIIGTITILLGIAISQGSRQAKNHKNSL